jgi:predicted phage tail protein
MRKIYLKGELGKKFGEVHYLGESIKTARDVIQLISSNRPGFREYITELARDGINFTLQVGKNSSIGEDELLLPIIKEDMILTPVPSGAGGKVGDFLKIIVGVVLIVLAATPWGAPFAPYLIAAGTSLITMGVTSLLAPDPATDDESATPESYLFSGAQQNTREGDPVPLLYGQLRVPGRPIAMQMTNGKFKV